MINHWHSGAILALCGFVFFAACSPSTAQPEPEEQTQSASEGSNHTAKPWPKGSNPAEIEAADALIKAFPNAIAPPPVFYGAPEDHSPIVLYSIGESLPPEGANNLLVMIDRSPSSPKVAHINARLAESGEVRPYLKTVMTDIVGFKITTRSETLEAPEWRTMHDARYWVEYGEAKFQGQHVRYCTYLYGDIVRVIFAPPDIFKSWGGPLGPLYHDGDYITDPESIPLESHKTLGGLTVQEQAQFHANLVERRMQDLSFGNLMISHAGIMQVINEGIDAEFRRARQ